MYVCSLVETAEVNYVTLKLYFCTYLAVSCPALPTAGINGQITYSVDTPPPYAYGTVAMYVCDSSYGVTGDSTLICGGDGSDSAGTWGSSTTTCERELR